MQIFLYIYLSEAFIGVIKQAIYCTVIINMSVPNIYFLIATNVSARCLTNFLLLSPMYLLQAALYILYNCLLGRMSLYTLTLCRTYIWYK